tara:strand:- start:15 stop:2387 length:2373 start_codon:yes stop_codon:yes gene_type:complete
MKKIIYLLIFISYSSFSQDYGNNQDVGKLCAAIQANNFTTDSAADNALEQILEVIGASKNFVLQPCSNINNALATSFNGIRYIFYDRDFMNTLNEGNDEGNLFILAHEVGHHINGHTVDWLLHETANKTTLSNRRKQELEADEFAGFILARLGGSISSINEVLVKISSNSDDSFSTHPSRDKRIFAAIKGFNKDSNNNSINNPKESISQKSKNINNEILFVGENSEKRWEGPVLTTPAYSYTDSEPVPDSEDESLYIVSIAESKEPYGVGVMYYPDGDIYKGAYYNGCPNGYGEMTYASGNIYKGQWLNCKKNGKGKIIKPSGVPVVTINGVEEGENHYNSGYSNYESGNYEEAILDFNKALKLEYNLEDIYYYLGNCHYYSSDYKNGIKYLSLSNKTRPFSYSYYLIGIMQFDEKNYEASINSITKSIELYDGDDKKFLSKKHTMRARAKYYKDDDNGALKDLEKAIELNPNDSFTFRFRAKVFNYLENYNAAIQDISKVIELDSESSDYVLRGENYIKLNDYKKAIADFTKAIDMDPNLIVCYNKRGDAKYDLKDYTGALADYTKAIELDPKEANYFKRRGDAKNKLKDYTGALADFTKAKELDPEEAIYLGDRGRAKYNLKDYTGALADYTKAIELDPEEAIYLGDRANAKYNLKDYTGAIKDYTKAIELDPEEAIYLGNRGRAKNELKDYTGAITDFTKAIELDPEEASYFADRARMYYELKKYKLAKKSVTKAIELEPSISFNYMLRAWHNYKLGDLISGCNDIKKAWKLNPDGEYEEIHQLVCN